MADYPRMLYRPGSMFEWDGEMFDYLVVANEDELKAAKGWSAEKPKGNSKGGDPAAAVDVKALRGEYKAKFGKAPFNGWDAGTLKAKLGGTE